MVKLLIQLKNDNIQKDENAFITFQRRSLQFKEDFIRPITFFFYRLMWELMLKTLFLRKPFTSFLSPGMRVL